jgi:Xaa-Pro aminopeptidase
MNNVTEVIQRIASVRSLMKENRIDAYLITGADPHLCEYPPEYWKTREWITGFTGSYGKVLVTRDKVLLWTDTRYFLQAGEELSGTGIILMKERVPEAISLTEWIAGNMIAGDTLAVDGLTISATEASDLNDKLGANGIGFRNDLDLVSPNWKMRPPMSTKTVYEHPIAFAGISRSEKIEMVRKKLLQNGKDSMVVSMLDDLAWLLNLRGDDIQYIPLFTAYCYLDRKDVRLFIEQGKISELTEVLANEGILVEPYDAFLDFLGRTKDQHVQIDPVRTNSLVVNSLVELNNVGFSPSDITQLKSVKSDHEINCIRNAHKKDGAALVNFLFWITHTIGKERITEVDVGKKLDEFRSRQDHFKGASFYPIVGFGPHGAIVHYHATENSDVEVNPGNLLLIDSGGHYLDGTTDITRTIALGIPTQKQKEDFTICLKGHISLANAIFPEEIRGYSLDPFARKPLWSKGINYGHGTGHGIGYFLSVHEGPMSIRAEFNNEPIREGNIISNEPGIYREGEYGIRVENVILCKKFQHSDFGNFLCFETISLCPLDRKLIVKELLSIDEITWIDHYHQMVFRNISPLIHEPEVLNWLKSQCTAL